MTAKIIIPCAILSIILVGGIALMLDIDYDRYADNVAVAITESVTETISSVSIQIDEIPKIPVFLGCADVYDKMDYLKKQYEALPEGTTAGDSLPLYLEGQELNAEILENNCQEWWIENRAEEAREQHLDRLREFQK